MPRYVNAQRMARLNVADTADGRRSADTADGRRSADTFQAPNPTELRAVVPGAIVKVSDGYQRFWAVVYEVVPAARAGDIKFRCLVDSKLIYGPAPRTKITVRGRHVFEVYEVSERA